MKYFAILAVLISMQSVAAEIERHEIVTKSNEAAEQNDDEVKTRMKVEETRVNAGTGEEKGGIVEQKSVITQETVQKGGLDDEIVGITLQAGLVNIGDDNEDGNTRAVGGLGVDGNFLADVKTKTGKPFFGPSVGVFYSHLGQPGANFFGLNSPGGDKGADLLLIPLNLKAGYTYRDRIRLSVHGGVSLNYLNSPRTVTTTTTTPTGTTTNTHTFRDDDWDTNANVGLDLEFGLGQDVLLLIRPDWTLRSGNDAFMATLGIGFPLS